MKYELTLNPVIIMANFFENESSPDNGTLDEIDKYAKYLCKLLNEQYLLNHITRLNYDKASLSRAAMRLGYQKTFDLQNGMGLVKIKNSDLNYINHVVFKLYKEEDDAIRNCTMQFFISRKQSVSHSSEILNERQNIVDKLKKLNEEKMEYERLLTDCNEKCDHDLVIYYGVDKMNIHSCQCVACEEYFEFIDLKHNTKFPFKESLFLDYSWHPDRETVIDNKRVILTRIESLLSKNNDNDINFEDFCNTLPADIRRVPVTHIK